MSITIDDDLELRIQTSKAVHGGGSARVVMDKRGDISVTYPLAVIYKSQVGTDIRQTCDADGLYPHTHIIYTSEIPAWVMGKFKRNWNGPDPIGLKERLHAEASAIVESLHPEVEAAIKKLLKRRMSQLTGDGATKRVDKAMELLIKHLHGLNNEFDIATFFRIVQVHAQSKFVMESNSMIHTLVISKKTMESAEKLRLDWNLAARVMAIFEGRNLSGLFHHVSSNPSHWMLLTEEDFRTSLNRAIVSSVMEV